MEQSEQSIVTGRSRKVGKLRPSEGLNLFQNRSCRPALFHRHQHDLATAGFDNVASHDPIRRPVRAFDQNIWLHGGDDFGGRLFIKNDDRVHARECVKDFGPFGFWGEWPSGTFDHAHRSIRVDRDKQGIALGPRGLEISHVAGMEQVEDAIGDNDFLAGDSSLICPCGRGSSGWKKHADQGTACAVARPTDELTRIDGLAGICSNRPSPWRKLERSRRSSGEGTGSLSWRPT